MLAIDKSVNKPFELKLLSALRLYFFINEHAHVKRVLITSAQSRQSL